MQLCVSVKTQKNNRRKTNIYNKEGYALMRVTYPSICEAVAYRL